MVGRDLRDIDPASSITADAAGLVTPAWAACICADHASA
jgi:hypothetical protein